MSVARAVASVAFIIAVAAGTYFDVRPVPLPATNVMVADLHVHPFPGDGALPVWELQREAARRGIDVIAITGHNNRGGLELGRLVPLDPGGPIVLPAQEITTPAFHLVAVGVTRMIDWRLPAREAIAAIHAQGGVAIAAHPVPTSWRDFDPEALRTLDGAEVAHPSSAEYSPSRDQFLQFFERVRSHNTGLAPIGSSDFHMTAPLGLCRTYLLVEERSPAGVLAAIRGGRTVAADPRGRLFGTPDAVAIVEAYRNDREGASRVTPWGWIPALLALVALAVLCAPERQARRIGRG